MSVGFKKEHLKKMSLVELKEILSRETVLLKKSNLIQKLPDKGESIKKFYELVQNEINYREKISKDTNSSEKSSPALNEKEKHIMKLCEFEKTAKDRYKPFATLNKSIEIKSERKVFKVMEDCKLDNKPTKLISLFESLNIQRQQDESLKEEKVKNRYERLMEKLKENNEDKLTSDEENSELASAFEEESD